jgi:hypothetical protein
LNVNLYTDAPKHNLALMKISAWHKQRGDEVTLNMPIMPCEQSYGSFLFEKSNRPGDEIGGVGCSLERVLNFDVEIMKPDYDLFPIDYSLGYTYRPCWRKCPFCKVWKMNHYDHYHHSIWEFHDPKFKKICLLNNNAFFDPQWDETFEEIWDANLTVVDENGYDLRLIDEEKAYYLRKTKFQGQIHYAWDRMQDETAILRGLAITPKGMVYVLIGYDTTEEEDIYRVQKIVDMGFDPYIMPYHQNEQEKRFKRFIGLFMWRKYKTIEEAWRNYGKDYRAVK